METNEHDIKLTSSEISSLWGSYQEDTLTICGINFFLKHVDDSPTQHILELALQMAKKRTEKVIHLFNEENYPIPQGFSDKDVNLNAPRLFSDKLYLEYILQSTNLSLVTYSMGLSFAARTDIIDFFTENLNNTQNLHKQAKELMKEKGIYLRAPQIPTPDMIHFVKNESFLAGWFEDRRPLLGIEISFLVFSSTRNALGQAVITGFSQVAETKEVRKYFERGREISGKHFEVFSGILNENYLADGAQLLTGEVTDSTISPFSDKLMMNFITTLIASGIGQYGTAISASPRHDLSAEYTRLMAEIARYSNDGAKIMIEKAWIEQPPMALNRKDLAKKK